VPWLRRLVAGLFPRMHGFAAGSVHVGLAVNVVALGQVYLRVLRVFLVDTIPPWFYAFVGPISTGDEQ